MPPEKYTEQHTEKYTEKHPENRSNAVRVALVGQPNVGKSSILNAISGSKVRVGNFPGVTVEKASASLRRGNTLIEVTDLPGTYSLKTYSQEERITKEFLDQGAYDVIVQVVESVNLERNLTFTAELMRLNRPLIVALNMIDEAKLEGIEINAAQLTEILGVPCIKVSAKTGEGLQTLIARMADATKFDAANKLVYSDQMEYAIDAVEKYLRECGNEEREIFGATPLRHIAQSLVFGDEQTFRDIHHKPLIELGLQPILQGVLEPIYTVYDTRDLGEIVMLEHRSFARGAALETFSRRTKPLKEALTDRIDRVLLHPVFGLPIFLFFMWALFQLTFTLGAFPMEYLEAFFGALGDAVKENVASEAVSGLIADGIIGGVGSVLLFLPNIMILFLGIALLESTGYMARAAFLLDGFLHKFGLHGKSFVPLVSGFGCSVPAFMAARTLKNDRDRLLTLFIINFMSCGARLPVYVLFIGVFFPPSMAGNALFAVYILGAFVGLCMAFVLRKTAFKGADEPFVMEMPRYRMPSLGVLWMMVWSKALMYMKKAGTFILATCVLIWFASNYPAYEGEVDGEELAAEVQLQHSYLGKTGAVITPVFAPFDFDWKLSVALVSGLAAKETNIATLGVLYSLGEVDEESETLQETLRANLTMPTAIAYMLFIMFYNPCLAATVVFKGEAGGWKYVLYLFIFTSVVAYLMALIGFGLASLIS